MGRALRRRINKPILIKPKVPPIMTKQTVFVKTTPLEACRAIVMALNMGFPPDQILAKDSPIRKSLEEVVETNKDTEGDNGET